LALIGVAIFIISKRNAAVESKLQITFSAPVMGNEQAGVQDAGPALDLGTFEIPFSNGRITFLDETPMAKTPSISVVIVEDAGFNTIADATQNETSALELFLTFAPSDTKIPERIKLAHDLRDERDTRGDRPISVTTMHLHEVSVPTVEMDDWGPDCLHIDDWTDGFTAWVEGTQLLTNASFQSNEVNIPGASQVYGYFGFNDTIWAGVCMRSGTTMHVGMQYRNHDGYWVMVGGPGSLLTKADLNPGVRYLYHNFKRFTAQRRIYVSSDPNDVPAGNFAYLSGAWKDNFAPDGTFSP